MVSTRVFNDSSYWRAFDENKVSHSVAHYLMAVDKLLTENGYARVTDVANLLKITRGAASLALSQLKEKGLITEDSNRFLLLTDKGRELSHIVVKNFLLLNRFFEDVLGIPNQQSREDACKMEHLLSRDSSIALHRFLQMLFTNKDLRNEITARIKETQMTCDLDETCELCEKFEFCLEPSQEQESGDMESSFS